MMLLEGKSLLANFLGTLCWTCLGAKRSKQSHCSACYHRLPKPMQTALYKRFGEGYEEAFTASVEWLRAHPAGGR